jgi:hypothetical protein
MEILRPASSSQNPRFASKNARWPCRGGADPSRGSVRLCPVIGPPPVGCPPRRAPGRRRRLGRRHALGGRRGGRPPLKRRRRPRPARAFLRPRVHESTTTTPGSLLSLDLVDPAAGDEQPARLWATSIIDLALRPGLGARFHVRNDTNIRAIPLTRTTCCFRLPPCQPVAVPWPRTSRGRGNEAARWVDRPDQTAHIHIHFVLVL